MVIWFHHFICHIMKLFHSHSPFSHWRFAERLVVFQEKDEGPYFIAYFAKLNGGNKCYPDDDNEPLVKAFIDVRDLTGKPHTCGGQCEENEYTLLYENWNRKQQQRPCATSTRSPTGPFATEAAVEISDPLVLWLLCAACRARRVPTSARMPGRRKQVRSSNRRDTATGPQFLPSCEV